ncbi:MAG: hypothetical protein IKF51_03525, partial [Solobacterium sp.]|nr:hypothetical protein [Solobacterium sp.]
MTAIVTLGVSFYVGVSSSSTIMADNVDAYNDQLNLKDITVYSAYGFDDEDIGSIRALEDVQDVNGTKFVDTVAYLADSAVIARVHSYDPDDTLNRFVLREGRLPERTDELLAEAGTDLMPGPPVGMTITLTRPAGDLEDWLCTDTYTVVGTIDTPLYLNETKENSTLSNRYIDTYFYVPEQAFTVDFDTEISVVYKGAKDYESFYAAYEARSEEVRDEIETLGKTQSLHRYDEILEEAMNAYNDGLSEYNDGLDTYNREIADAERELADAAAEINDGKQKLADAENEINDAQQELDEQIAAARKQISDGRAELEAGKKQLEQGKKEYEEQKKTYSALRDQLTEAVSSLEEARDGLAQIDAGIGQLDEAEQLLEEIKTGDIPVSLFMEAYPDMKELADALGIPGSTTVRELMTMTLSDTETGQQLADQINQDLGPLLDENVSVGELVEEYPGLADLLNIMGLDETSQASEVLQHLTDTAVAELPEVQALISGADYAAMLSNLPVAVLRAADPRMDTLISMLGLSDNATLQDTLDAVRAKKQELQETRKGIVEQLRQNGINENELDAKIKEYRDSIKQIDDGLAEGLKQIQDAEQQIKDGEAALADGEAELERQRADAQALIDEGRKEIEENRQTLNDAEAEYNDGVRKLEEARIDGAQELEDARADLDKALDDINNLEKGTWTVLTREEHYASRTFRNTVETMAAIAAIFPLFFILVSALVCLT